MGLIALVDGRLVEVDGCCRLTLVVLTESDGDDLAINPAEVAAVERRGANSRVRLSNNRTYNVEGSVLEVVAQLTSPTIS